MKTTTESSPMETTATTTMEATATETASTATAVPSRRCYGTERHEGGASY